MSIVLVTPEEIRDNFDSDWARRLQGAGFEIRFPRNSQLSRGGCGEVETIAEYEGAIAAVAGVEGLSRSVMTALPNLKVIARTGVGCDRVDLEAATELGIAVTITPNSTHEAAAEHALALILCVAKEISMNDRNMHEGRWVRRMTEPVRQRTLGLVGFGRIGKSLATRARALGMTVIACDDYADRTFAAAHEVEIVSFDEVLRRADYLSVHCPVTPQTRGMFNSGVFARMKPGSVFINAARGALVIEADLVHALQNGPMRAAGLDVFDREPASPDNPLLKLPNVVLTPHLAGTDTQSMQDMASEAAQSIVDLSQGRWPKGASVNPQVAERWQWSTLVGRGG